MVCINGRIITTQLDYYTLHFVTNAEFLEIIISNVVNYSKVGITKKSYFIVVNRDAHPTSRTKWIRSY